MKNEKTKIKTYEDCLEYLSDFEGWSCDICDETIPNVTKYMIEHLRKHEENGEIEVNEAEENENGI